MGLNYVTTRLRDLSGTGPEYTAEFLVDTGAVDCLADGDELRAIGLPVAGRGTYELADGTTAVLEYGFARVNVLGAETVTQVIFAPPGTDPILGVVVLENIGIVVDPRSKTLKRLDAKPLKRLH